MPASRKRSRKHEPRCFWNVPLKSSRVGPKVLAEGFNLRNEWALSWWS